MSKKNTNKLHEVTRNIIRNEGPKNNVYKSHIIEGIDVTELEKTSKKIREEHGIIFNEMKMESSKLISISDKLNYWSSKMTYFTTNILTTEISIASGHTIQLTRLNEKLYLDRMIQDEIDFLLKLEKPENRFISTEQNLLQHESIELDKWNEKTAKLFEYFVRNYNSTPPIQKFINIWHFLKYDTDKDFLFNWSHKKYSYMVNRAYGIEIKKINKPNNYASIQYGIMKNIYNEYLNG